MNKNKVIISSAPLQGFTDYVFRNLINKYFGGIDYFYAPYIKTSTQYKTKQFIDIDPKYNSVNELIPQIMSKDVNLTIELCNKLYNEYGYNEINWNIGCPYPMVTTKKLGSGILPYPELIEQFLNGIIGKIPQSLSIKTRLGFESSDEIFKIIDTFNKFPLKEIIIHPRIGKDKYSGSVDLKTFAQTAQLIKHPIVYNGDITTIDDFRSITAIFPNVDSIMIGRGLISNPALAATIKATNYGDFETQFRNFYNDLICGFQERYDNGVTIQKITTYWKDYWSNNNRSIFTFVSDKHLKKIKKAKTISELYF